MPSKKIYAKDREVRIILAVVLVLVGLTGFGGYGMMSMMGYYGGYSLYGNLISIGLVVLGVYLIYDGLRKD